MATTQARRYIEIDIEANKALRELKDLNTTAARTERQLTAMRKQMSLVGDLFRGWALFEVVQGLIRLSDTTINLDARLKSVTDTLQETNDQFDTLLEISNRNGVAVDSLTAAYVKFQTAVPTAETEDLNNILDTTSFILAKTGAGVQQTNAVLLQLSQSLGAGALQGDEFRSVAENAPVLLRAWREAIGRTDLSFKELSAAALLTTKSLVENADAVRANTERMIGAEAPPLTVARAFTQLRNNFIDLMRDFQSEAPVFQLLAEAIVLIADNLALLTQALVAATAAFIAFKAAAVGAAAISALAGAFTAAGTAAAGLGAALAALAKWFGVKGLLAVGVGTAVFYIIEEWEKVKFLADNWEATWELIAATLDLYVTELLRSVTDVIAELLRRIVAFYDRVAKGYLALGSALQGTGLPGLTQIGEGVSTLGQGAVNTSVALTGFAESVTVTDRTLARASQRLIDAQVNMENLEVQSLDTQVATGRIDENLNDIATSGGKAGSGADKAAKELAKMNKVLRDGEASLNKYLAALDEEILKTQLTDKQLAIRKVNLELQAKASDAARKALDAEGKGLLQVADAQNKVAQAYRDAIPLAERKAATLYDLQNGTESLARTFDETIKTLEQGLQDTATQAFIDFFDNGLDSAKDFFKNLGNLFKQEFAKLASYLLFNPLQIGTAGGVLGGVAQPAGGGGTGGALTAASVFSNAARLFTTGSTTLAQAATRFAGFLGAGPGSGAAAAFGSAVGIGGPWAGLAAAISGALGGDIGTTIGSAAGSAAGAVLGNALLPGIGTVLGGILGGAGGGFLGGLFGGDNEPDPKVIIAREAGNFVLQWSQDFSNEQLAELEGVVGNVNSELNALAQVLGPEAQRALASSGDFRQALTDEVIGDWLEHMVREASEAMFSAVGGNLGEVLSEAFDVGGTGGVSQTIQLLEALGEVVNVVDPGAVDSIDAAADFFQSAGRSSDPITDLNNLIVTMGGAQQSIQSMQSFVDALLQAAGALEDTRAGIEEFGLSEAEIYQRRRESADLLMDALGEMVDPQRILDTVGELNDLINQGWNILSETQKGALRQQFLDYIDEVDALAEARLAIGAADQFGGAGFSLEGSLVETARIMADLDGSLGNSAVGFESASEEMRVSSQEFLAAVREFQAAARSIPGNIVVTVDAAEVQ